MKYQLPRDFTGTAEEGKGVWEKAWFRVRPALCSIPILHFCCRTSNEFLNFPESQFPPYKMEIIPPYLTR